MQWAAKPAGHTVPALACTTNGAASSVHRVTFMRGCRLPPTTGIPMALKLYSLNSSLRQEPLHNSTATAIHMLIKTATDTQFYMID